MNNQDMKALWLRACGDTPPEFLRRMRGAAAEQGRKNTRRLRPALALALGLTLILGSAFALERLGLLDTLHSALRSALLPQAREMVKSDIPFEAKQPELARFALEEAVYDGHQVYLTLRARPADPGKTLLMDRSALPAWAADYRETGNQMRGESFAEKALAKGQRLVQAWAEEVSVSGETLSIHVQEVLYQEDSLLYTLAFPASGEEARVRLHLMAPDIYRQADESARGTLDFSLPKSPHIKTFAAKTPLDLPLSGLRLLSCQVETTPIASYLSLRYALKEGASPLQAVNLADGIWADWLDASGNPRESGDTQLGLDRQDDGSVRLTQSFGALKEAPKDITLSFYNGMTKERFDRVTLTLSPKEEN